jgi:hypothetical protein
MIRHAFGTTRRVRRVYGPDTSPSLLTRNFSPLTVAFVTAVYTTSMETLPPVGVSRPAAQCVSVLLPDPDGP